MDKNDIDPNFDLWGGYRLTELLAEQINVLWVDWLLLTNQISKLAVNEVSEQINKAQI